MFVILKMTKTKIETIGPFKTRKKAESYLFSPRFKKYLYQHYYIREIVKPKNLAP